MLVKCWGGPLDGEEREIPVATSVLLYVYQEGALTRAMGFMGLPDTPLADTQGLIGSYAVGTNREGKAHLVWRPRSMAR